ncbi:MAG: EmrB/QacA subfamily drug resistance transporter [Acidimicrobiales bacterium]|jgi:EmrB/QacA subfamily drug resistance transporter
MRSLVTTRASSRGTAAGDGGRALAVLAGSFGIVSVALSAMNVAFDALVTEFSGTSTATLGWTLTGYTTMTAALLIAAGRIADAYGRTRTFLVGVAVFGAASVLGAVAWSPAAIIGARMVQGVGAALVTPTSLALLLTIYPPSKRSTVIGIWGSVGAVAAAGGPAFGGLVVDTLGWRWIFWFNVPVCLLLGWFGHRWLERDQGDAQAGAPDALGIALSALAVGALALGLGQSGEWGWADPRTVGTLAAGPIFAVVVTYRSSRHPVPVLDLALFRLRSFNAGNIVNLLFNVAFSAMILNNVLFLSRVWGYSQTEAGFGITPSPLSAALVAQLAGRAADRIGPRALIIPGIALFAAALIFLAFGIGTEPAYWTRWFPAALCFGTGVGLTFTNVSSISVCDVPPARLAVASATNGAARSIGTVLGPAFVVGTIGAASGVEAVAIFDRVWLVSAVVAGAALVFAWFLPGQPKATLPQR